ncbi:MAG TPA: NAD-dependent epimerase/dehydratase family protein, partial [Caulobacteraceae bacterium]|nr:NAD-dependent epimerase/dehydratase family protein [Caulobacteraceae bacterium]
MSAGRLAAVTGATGFLGRRLVPALAAAGWRVRVLARGAPEPGLWDETDPEILRGDLADEAALAALARDA